MQYGHATKFSEHCEFEVLPNLYYNIEFVVMCMLSCDI